MYISAQLWGTQGHFGEVIEKDGVFSTFKASQPTQHRRGSFHFADNIASMSSWKSHSAFAGWTLTPLYCQAVLMLISVHIRYHGGSGSPHPLTPCVSKGIKRRRKFRKRLKFHHMSMVGFIAMCSGEKDMWRSHQEGLGPLDASIYLATQMLTATSILTQGQAHHHVILKLGTLILLTVWMGETTQRINKSKAMEASHMYRHRQLKNNPRMVGVFFQKKNGIFSSCTLTEVRRLSCSLHWETSEGILTSFQCCPAPTNSSRHSSILTEHLYKANAKLFWQKSPK